MNKIIFVFLPLFLLLRFTPAAHASSMTSDGYILNLQTIQSSPTPTPVSKPNDPVDPRMINGENFKVFLGHPYVFPVDNFIFSMSTNIIDFGLFSPTNPISRTQLLTVNAGSANTFTITASENHELSLVDGTSIVIPNTTCDDGLCSSKFASDWVNTLTYGFGYHCRDVSQPQGCLMSKEHGFKQFPITDPQPIIIGAGAGETFQSEITYKLNTSTTQPQGIYTNIITLTALPGF